MAGGTARTARLGAELRISCDARRLDPRLCVLAEVVSIDAISDASCVISAQLDLGVGQIGSRPCLSTKGEDMLRHKGRMTAGATVRFAIAIACLASIAAGCSSSSSGNDASPTGTSAAVSDVSPVASASVAASPVPSPAAGGAADAMAGTWSGTWNNTFPAPAAGAFQIQWTAKGSDALVGTIVVSGAGCVANAKIVAALDGGNISFGAVQGASSVRYTGSAAGDTMSGTYAASATCANAKGTWKATKTG